MARRPPPPVFLGRSSYRQRRLRDAARMLPVAGMVLWLIPLFWDRGVEGTRNSQALLYIFAVWIVLIVLAAVLARVLRPDNDDADREDAD